MKQYPSVTIIVLNWNGRTYLESCLIALAAQDYPHYSMVLVDNGSTDDSLSFVTSAFPNVRIIENGRNLGYAAGNNRALQEVKTEIAVLVNPDIVVKKGWLTNLIQPFMADDSIGIAGCKLFYPGEKLLQHAGGEITHPRAMPAHRGLREPDLGAYEALIDVDYVIGAAFAIRRKVLDQGGFLDEGFFMYFEDADLCRRVKDSGFRVVYVPGAVAVHDESAFAGKGSYTYLKQFHAGRWRYLLKHFDPVEILEESLPAETSWLMGISGQERLALDQAYRAARKSLPAIIQIRENNGPNPIPEGAQVQIDAGLRRLRASASNHLEEDPTLFTLSRFATGTPQPYRSSIPLFGPIIAGFRSLWAGMAAREFVSSLGRQQNLVNRLWIEEFRENERRLQLQTAVRLDEDEDRVELQKTIIEIRQEIKATYQRIVDIHARLESLQSLKSEIMESKEDPSIS